MTGQELYTRICEARNNIGGVNQFDSYRAYRFTQPMNDDQGAWAAFSFLPNAEKRMLNRVADELVTRRGASRVKP